MVNSRKTSSLGIFNKGFTLIEVLIALAILSISLTAIIKATGADIRNTARLKDKAIASLVATNAISLIQLNILRSENGEINQTTSMGNKKWYWQAFITKDKKLGLQDIQLNIYLKHKLILSEHASKLINNS